MWRKITLFNGDGDKGNTAHRVDEEFEGDFGHAKTLIALQNFDNVRDMYIQDLDEDPKGDVSIYRISIDRARKITFRPIAFHPEALEPFCKGKAAKALINLRAFTEREAGQKIEELLSALETT